MKQDGAIEWRVEVIDSLKAKSPVNQNITNDSGSDNVETHSAVTGVCSVQRASHCLLQSRNHINSLQSCQFTMSLLLPQQINKVCTVLEHSVIITFITIKVIITLCNNHLYNDKDDYYTVFQDSTNFAYYHQFKLSRSKVKVKYVKFHATSGTN